MFFHLIDGFVIGEDEFVLTPTIAVTDNGTSYIGVENCFDVSNLSFQNLLGFSVH